YPVAVDEIPVGVHAVSRIGVHAISRIIGHGGASSGVVREIPLGWSRQTFSGLLGVLVTQPEPTKSMRLEVEAQWVTGRRVARPEQILDAAGPRLDRHRSGGVAEIVHGHDRCRWPVTAMGHHGVVAAVE